MRRFHILLVTATWGGLLIEGGGQLKAQQIQVPVRTPVFSFERVKGHLGRGAAISPDGDHIVFIGDDNALYVHDLSSKATTQLLSEAGPGFDVFSSPAFSPDGRWIAFSASGGTMYYPSEIFVIGTDGADLRRLTFTTQLAQGEENGRPFFALYNDKPLFSPDGAKLSFNARDIVHAADYIGVVGRGGSDYRLIGDGEPLAWIDSASISYVDLSDGRVGHIDIATGETVTLTFLKGPVVGSGTEADVVELAGDDVIRVLNTDSGQLTATVSVLSRRLSSRSVVPGRPVAQDHLKLRVASVSRGNLHRRVLLTYEGEDNELIEVLDLPKLGQ